MTVELLTAEVVTPRGPMALSTALDHELSTDARYGVDVPLDLDIDGREPDAGSLGA